MRFYKLLPVDNFFVYNSAMALKDLTKKIRGLIGKVPSKDDVTGSIKESEEKIKQSGEKLKADVSESIKKSEEKIKESGQKLKDGVSDGIKKSGDKIKDGLHLNKEDEDPSSTQSTFESRKDFSVFNDPDTPWFRRWYMFAFIYPTFLSFILEFLRRFGGGE